uniref:Uncharacterized protein n=1 Tax=Babesia bovis TaxID=5865 RepID=S6BKF7_BABBO|nr:hypothetical protein [Babesia bovis]
MAATSASLRYKAKTSSSSGGNDSTVVLLVSNGSWISASISGARSSETTILNSSFASYLSSTGSFGTLLLSLFFNSTLTYPGVS